MAQEVVNTASPGTLKPPKAQAIGSCVVRWARRVTKGHRWKTVPSSVSNILNPSDGCTAISSVLLSVDSRKSALSEELKRATPGTIGNWKSVGKVPGNRTRRSNSST
eukprot:scaffold64_cov338-Pavlova_lutheri.AAC.38